jgi:hypothetical protein
MNGIGLGIQILNTVQSTKYRMSNGTPINNAINAKYLLRSREQFNQTTGTSSISLAITIDTDQNTFSNTITVTVVVLSDLCTVATKIHSGTPYRANI